MIVVDASALIKYLIREEGWEKTRRYLYEERPLYSVDHLAKEVGNGLWKHCQVKQVIDCKTSLELYLAFKDLILTRVILLKPEFDYLDEAMKIAVEDKITVYDALYIALAVELGELLTSDEKQARIAEKRGVKIHHI